MSEEKIISYKGFDENLKCHGGFQYALGKEYEQDGEIKACHNGFHACERPLDVFNHFSPAGSRFCVVEQSGYRGAATAGDGGFALSGGSASAGENGIAVAHGENPKAKGKVGTVLVLAQTDGAGNPICVKTAVVDGGEVKPDTWYTLKNRRLTIWNGVK